MYENTTKLSFKQISHYKNKKIVDINNANANRTRIINIKFSLSTLFFYRLWFRSHQCIEE